MQVTILFFLAVAAVVSASPAFPKKYDPKIHGLKQNKQSTYGNYRKKYEYDLKAPENHSYDRFVGQPEDPILPPDQYPYSTAEGEAYGDLSPPPQVSTSSYLVYDREGEKVAMVPPPVSSYATIPATNETADTMSLLRFMVRALPQASSYSQYEADSETEPEVMNPPEQRPDSSYTKYSPDDSSDTLIVPATVPKVDKSVSSYSSYQ